MILFRCRLRIENGWDKQIVLCEEAGLESVELPMVRAETQTGDASTVQDAVSRGGRKRLRLSVKRRVNDPIDRCRRRNEHDKNGS